MSLIYIQRTARAYVLSIWSRWKFGKGDYIVILGPKAIYRSIFKDGRSHWDSWFIRKPKEPIETWIRYRNESGTALKTRQLLWANISYIHTNWKLKKRRWKYLSRSKKQGMPSPVYHTRHRPIGLLWVDGYHILRFVDLLTLSQLLVGSISHLQCTKHPKAGEFWWKFFHLCQGFLIPSTWQCPAAHIITQYWFGYEVSVLTPEGDLWVEGNRWEVILRFIMAFPHGPHPGTVRNTLGLKEDLYEVAGGCFDTFKIL